MRRNVLHEECQRETQEEGIKPREWRVEETNEMSVVVMEGVCVWGGEEDKGDSQ